MILALDPSTKLIGWAMIGRDAFYQGGVIKLGGPGLNDRCFQAHAWMDEALVHNPYMALAIEIPVMHRNVKVLRSLSYINGALRAAAGLYDMYIVDVLPSQRLTTFGLRGNTKRDLAKEWLRKEVEKKYGLHPEFADNDIVDATAVGVAALEMIDEQRRKDQGC